MNNRILAALKSIPVAELDRAAWLAVGMALKQEGFPSSVWDEWSRNDNRYHHGECERLWKGFHGSEKPVTGGTILQMAKDRGWTDFGPEDCLDWDDEISYDGEEAGGSAAASGASAATAGLSCPDSRNPTEDLIRYLETIFESEDRVAYVTSDVWQTKEEKWAPGKGAWDRTAGRLIAELRKHPEDIGAVIGDWKEEAGAWIRFNPVDGQGVKNENVTRFRYALVESDELSIEEQYALYRKLELPIAALVHSGGKSLHAIVHVDAENLADYRKRVDYLYAFLTRNGMPVDRQNRNPSRLSRIPGVTRNGNRQFLVATNIGRKSWIDWLDFAEGISDDLPEMTSLSIYKDHPPVPPEELIQGVLRRGHKMLISGPSKAGKSFLLMELCISIAEGLPWLGFPCRKGRVLYINLEIDPASSILRFLEIYDVLGITADHMDDIVVWNLRGHALPLDQLVPKLIRRIKHQHFDAIVLDPIYKVITGDENSATEMGAFCNEFDKICDATGCATIYCHHHSKGAQGMKKAMDRASGSGVFARDPDAQLDIIGLELTDDIINNVQDDDATGWRLEGNLREFRNFKPFEFWFEHPIHRLDHNEYLKKLPAQGTFKAGMLRNSRSKTTEEANEEFRNAFNIICMGSNSVALKDIAEYLELAPKTIYGRVERMEDEFRIEKKHVIRLEPLENKELEPDLPEI